MNTWFPDRAQCRTILIVAVASSFTLVGCATPPGAPEGAAEVRAKLTQLQSDPNLAGRVPVALEEAEAAVELAEQPLAADESLGAHRVFMADRKVEIAMARAATDYAVGQRATLSEERAKARLDARTREADQARQRATAARSEADAARTSADEAARAAALDAEELRRQIEVLEAEATDRGLVLTLGDVLFATGRAELKPGATQNLDKLVGFLSQYPNRSVEIEGHTDNVGSEAYNQGLSERRAESVKSYLAGQGIGSQRLTASGMGMHHPRVDNTTPDGRQQNRRVEIIILNPTSSPAA
jgi:outer membrane protein OmpA-like peptidoglycan-associated protein